MESILVAGGAGYIGSHACKALFKAGYRPVTLDSLRSDCTVILLPEFNEPEEAVAHIDEQYEQLFKVEVASWYDDEDLWPKDMSLKAFWEWFDVEIHSTVLDTVDADISNTPTSEL